MRHLNMGNPGLTILDLREDIGPTVADELFDADKASRYICRYLGYFIN